MNTYIIEKATVLFVAHSFTLFTDEGSCRKENILQLTIKSIIHNEHDKHYVILYMLYIRYLARCYFSGKFQAKTELNQM